MKNQANSDFHEHRYGNIFISKYPENKSTKMTNGNFMPILFTYKESSGPLSKIAKHLSNR